MDTVKIKLPDYKEIAAKTKRRPVFVEEKDMADALSWLKKSRAKFSLKNGPAAKGDFVEIEYEYGPASSAGRHDKKIQDGFILEESGLPKGFDGKLIGGQAGETKEFELALSDGQKTSFKVNVKSVQSVELAELNDELAKGLGKFEDLTGLRKSIKQGLQAEKEMAETQRIRQEIVENISQESKVDIPAELIALEKKQILEGLKNKIKDDLKITLEEYLTRAKQTEEELMAAFLPQIESRLKSGLILKAIAEKEKIESTDDEIEKTITEMLKRYENPEQAKKDLDAQQLKDYAKEMLKQEKTLVLLEGFAR